MKKMQCYGVISMSPTGTGRLSFVIGLNMFHIYNKTLYHYYQTRCTLCSTPPICMPVRSTGKCTHNFAKLSLAWLSSARLAKLGLAGCAGFGLALLGTAALMCPRCLILSWAWLGSGSCAQAQHRPPLVAYKCYNVL